MSDLEHSTVTYTSISSDDGSLDVGSPKVILYGYDGLHMMPEDPYAHVEAAMQEPPLPDYVPEPAYPEFIPPEDDVFPTEEQPLSTDDPKEEDDEDPEEDPADCPTDRDDEEEEESSRDDADEEEEDEGKEEEEEKEHLAPADSVPPDWYPWGTNDRPIPSSPLPVSLPLPISPSPLPVSPTHSLGYSGAMIRLRAKSPSTSYPLPLPPSIIFSCTRASMVMMRAAAPSTYCLAPPFGTPPLLPILLPTSSPPFLLPSTDCRADVLEVRLPPRKRLCVAPGPRYKIGESSYAPTTRPTRGFRRDCGFFATLDAEIRHDLDKEIRYEITDIWVDPDEIAEEILATDVAELGQRMTDFVTTIRQGTDEIYVRLEDAQDAKSVMSGQLNLLRKDRRFHDRTARLMESEARVADMYGYCKNLKKTVKAGQTRTREQKECKRAGTHKKGHAANYKETHQSMKFALKQVQKKHRGLTHGMPRWKSVGSSFNPTVMIKDPMMGKESSYLDDKLTMEELIGLLLAYPCDKLELQSSSLSIIALFMQRLLFSTLEAQILVFHILS
ncbi:hypothetical protein Tco_0795293 [Tanacetum coccineum]